MKVGLMGAGFMGKTHAEIFHKLEDVELTACLDQDEDRVAQIAKETSCMVFTDAETFFQKGGFDVVDICLPTYLHEQIILKSLEAGKHVLCEKPLTLSSKSGKRIRDALKKTDLKFMVAQVIRFWPQYRKIREMIQDGAIGEIETIHAYRLSEIPQWASWFRIPEKGGGALFDLHIHDLDFIYVLCGKPQSLYTTGMPGEFGAWDSISSTLRWEDKYAVIHGDWKHLKGFPLQFGIRVRGKEGTLEYCFKVSGNVELKTQALEELTFATHDHTESIDCQNYRDGYEEEILYFLDCVRNNKPVEEATIDQVLDVLKLVEEEKASLETGERREIMGP